MGKVIDAHVYAEILEKIIIEQREKYAGDDLMQEAIGLLDLAKDFALDQAAAPALMLSAADARCLMNDTLYKMEHLMERQGPAMKYGMDQRKSILERLQQFERIHYQGQSEVSMA